MSATIGVDFRSHSTKVFCDVLSLAERDKHKTSQSFDFVAHEGPTGPNLTLAFSALQRFLGRSFRSADDKQQEYLAEEQAFLDISLVETNKGEMGVELLLDNGLRPRKVVCSVTLLVSLLFRKIVNTVTRSSGDAALNMRTAIAIPAWFSDAEHHALFAACSLAGMRTVGLISRTSAAALYYGMSILPSIPAAAASLDGAGHNAVFIDIGNAGSTISIKSFTRAGVWIAGNSFSSSIGARNFDWFLASHLAGNINLQGPSDISKDKEAWSSLMEACKRVREELESSSEALFRFYWPAADRTFEAPLTRRAYSAVAISPNHLDLLFQMSLLHENLSAHVIHDFIFLTPSSTLMKDDFLKFNLEATVVLGYDLVAKGALLASKLLSSHTDGGFFYFVNLKNPRSTPILYDDLSIWDAQPLVYNPASAKVIEDLSIAVDSPSELDNLAQVHYSNFKQSADVKELDKTIELWQKVLDLTPDEHSRKFMYLSNLGASLDARYNVLDDIQDLNAAVKFMQLAIDLLPDTHAEKGAICHNYSTLLVTHYTRVRDKQDLKTAKIHINWAISDLNQKTSPNLSMLSLYKNTLGNIYQTVFSHSGKLKHLNKAIKNHQDSLNLCQDNTSRISVSISLGNVLVQRAQYLEDQNDLTKAISVITEAVNTTPDGHPSKALYINNLTIAQKALYMKSSEVKILLQAIKWQEYAIRLMPNGHARKFSYLANLGNLKMLEFEHNGDIETLNNAFSIQEMVLQMTPLDNPKDRQIFLTNLGSSLLSRFKISKNLDDLENAIAYSLEAADLPVESTVIYETYVNLGRALYQRFFAQKSTIDLHTSIANFKKVVQSAIAPTSLKFFAVRDWQNSTLALGNGPMLQEASNAMIDLIPQLAWSGLNINTQFEIIQTARQIACDAAAIAMNNKDPMQAVEWLEQGRSVVWNHIVNLRTPITSLKDCDPDLAKKILDLSKQLEQATIRDADVFITDSLLEENNQRLHILAEERKKLISQAQETYGLKQKKKYSEFTVAALDGPVIIVNISELGCHAIIIKSPDPFTSPPYLTLDFSYKQAVDLQTMLQECLQSQYLRQAETYDNSMTDLGSERGKPIRFSKKKSDSIFRHILKELWDKIVGPIIQYLDIKAVKPPGDMHHFWWCPTGPLTFLPLHAAGIYPTSDDLETSGISIMDYVISSYTPSLGILDDIISKRFHPEKFNSSLKIFAVIQPNTPGQSPLPETVKEMDIIQRHAAQYPLQVLKGSEATVEAVINGMKDYPWVHLACHGKQDINEPTNSALFLDDGNLSLLNIIQNPHPQADFAFLSACQTASGDIKQPDEAIHLAAGMLLAGFNGVIATMWSIGDKHASVVTESVYEYLFKDHPPNSRNAAKALHRAIVDLRTKTEVSFSSWIPYIHVGS